MMFHKKHTYTQSIMFLNMFAQTIHEKETYPMRSWPAKQRLGPQRQGPHHDARRTHIANGTLTLDKGIHLVFVDW